MQMLALQIIGSITIVALAIYFMLEQIRLRSRLFAANTSNKEAKEPLEDETQISDGLHKRLLEEQAMREGLQERESQRTVELLSTCKAQVAEVEQRLGKLLIVNETLRQKVEDAEHRANLTAVELGSQRINHERDVKDRISSIQRCLNTEEAAHKETKQERDELAKNYVMAVSSHELAIKTTDEEREELISKSEHMTNMYRIACEDRSKLRERINKHEGVLKARYSDIEGCLVNISNKDVQISQKQGLIDELQDLVKRLEEKLASALVDKDQTDAASSVLVEPTSYNFSAEQRKILCDVSETTRKEIDKAGKSLCGKDLYSIDLPITLQTISDQTITSGKTAGIEFNMDELRILRFLLVHIKHRFQQPVG